MKYLDLPTESEFDKSTIHDGWPMHTVHQLKSGSEIHDLPEIAGFTPRYRTEADSPSGTVLYAVYSGDSADAKCPEAPQWVSA